MSSSSPRKDALSPSRGWVTFYIFMGTVTEPNKEEKFRF